MIINLLPSDVKESITYARRNTLLLNWCVALASGIMIVVLFTAAGQLYLSQVVAQNEKQLALSRNQLKLQKVEETQKRVESISGSLKLVVQVLSKEVLFSKLLQQIGAAMPPNTALTGLSINKLQGGIDLEAAASDYKTASQVQVNMSDPQNKLFNKADIVSISCGETAESTTGGYPCKVRIRAQFATNNPFLFINSGSN